jgi:tripartite-type tricarboxylate transporter receptor subunit TctC
VQETNMHRAIAVIILTLFFGNALAQTFPSRPVRVIVPFPPGGSADALARVLAPGLSDALGQPVLIENKPGASANIGADHVAKAAPDGHTLLLGTPALGVSAAVFTKLTYDAQRDLAPVAMLSVFPSVLVVHPSVPATTPQELVRHAKANPGALNFASTGTTSAIRFAFEHFRQITGIEAVHVPYKGSAPAGQAMLGGEVQVMMMTLVDALPHLRSGKLRAVAATGAKRIAVLPEVPTLAETVAPGFDYLVWHGLLTPAGTPTDVVEKLNQVVNAVLQRPEVQERLTGMGMEVRPGAPQALGQLIAEEIVKWKEVARIADIRAD